MEDNRLLRETLRPARLKAQGLVTAWLVMLLALLGCSRSVTTPGSYTSKSDNFVVRVPQGWKMVAEDNVVMTRDGVSLQRIMLGRLPGDQELPYAKKPVAESKSPQQLLSAIAEDLRSNPNVEKQEIIEEGSTEVGGHPGIKVVYRYRTKDGLTTKGVQYGVLLGDWYYYLIYEAPARHYFERDLATFETVKESFKIP